MRKIRIEVKDTIKAIGLFVVGLTVAVIVYPVIHELAHSLVAIAVGARVVEINILPVPSVLCDVKSVDSTGMVAIGMGGMLLPYFLSAVIKPKNFWIWYANYIVKGISALAFVISTISTVCFLVGSPLPNDDTTQTLLTWSGGKWICLVISFGLTILAIVRLIQEKPLDHCIRYFDVASKKTASAA